MFAVIFEVKPKAEGKDEYLQIAGKLREFLQDREGFISIERFQSLTEEGKILSLSFWRDEESIDKWRNLMEHRITQKKRLSTELCKLINSTKHRRWMNEEADAGRWERAHHVPIREF